MLWRHACVAVVFLTAILLLCAAPALAGPPPHQGFNNGLHGQGRGKDPCDKPHLPAYCQQAPEAPAGLMYPSAAAAALTLFFCFERRRRRRSTAAG
jgi:hypothetical protein